MIITDSRESRSGIPARLAAMGIDIQSRELAVGDYLIDDRLIVERKDADDFAASIMDQRLFGQATQMAALAERSVLVLEGDLSRIYSSIESESLTGALTALTLFYDVSVISVQSPYQTAAYIGRLHKQLTEGLGYEIPLRGRKPKVEGAQAQYLVEGLPQVGPETARKLLTHFGSPRATFAASSSELLAVKGIGSKMAAAITAALEITPAAYISTKHPRP